jgi:hypothetical protein
MRNAGSGECGSEPERKLQGHVGIPSRSPRTPRRPSGQLLRSADRRKPRPRQRGEVQALNGPVTALDQERRRLTASSAP